MIVLKFPSSLVLNLPPNKSCREEGKCLNKYFHYSRYGMETLERWNIFSSGTKIEMDFVGYWFLSTNKILHLSFAFGYLQTLNVLFNRFCIFFISFLLIKSSFDFEIFKCQWAIPPQISFQINSNIFKTSFNNNN